MRGRRLIPRSALVVLIAALVAPAGLVAAAHSFYNGTYYCSLNSSADGMGPSATVAEGSTVTHRITFCQRYTGWTTGASYFGGTRVAGPSTIHLNAGQTGTIAINLNAGGPGAKELTGYIVASFNTPGPSLYNGYDHIDLTVVGNPTTPSVGEDHNPSGWSTHNHPHWTWSASAASGSIARYEVDPTWAAPFQTTGTDWHPTLPSGQWGLRVRAQNNVGVWGPWSGIVYANVDVDPPTTTASLAGTAGSNGWWRSGVTATLGASDPHSGVGSTSKSVDGAAFSAYTGPFAIGGEGTHSLQYRSTDNLGNAEATRSTAVRIDSVAPATTFAVSAPSVVQGGTTYLTGAARVTLGATDATSGVAGTTYNLGSGAVGYAGPFGLTGADGARTLAFGSTDVAGNAEPAQSRALFLDNTAPRSNLAAGSPSVPDAAGTFVTSATPISVGAVDSGVGVAASYHRVDAGAWQEGSPFTLLGPDGRYGVQAYARDRLGNTEAPAVAATFQVDDTAPDLAFTAPAPDTLYAAGQAIPIPLPDCGAAPPCAAPLLSKANRPAFILGGTTLTLASDATDPVVNGVASGMARVRYALDGALLGEATAAPWTLAWDTSGVAGGPHTLTATALDRLGNAATVERTVLVLVATPGGALATPPYLLSLVEPPGVPPVGLPPIEAPPLGDPCLVMVDDPLDCLPEVPVEPPVLPGIPPELPPVGPPGVPSVKPVFSAVVDPNSRSITYRVGLEVDGQFIGDARTIDL